MTNLTILEALNKSLAATKKYVDDKVNTDKFKSVFTSDQWVLNTVTNNYELSVTHNLASEDLGLFVRDTTNNCELFLDYIIVDANNITIVNDEAANCTVKIISF